MYKETSGSPWHVGTHYVYFHSFFLYVISFSVQACIASCLDNCCGSCDFRACPGHEFTLHTAFWITLGFLSLGFLWHFSEIFPVSSFPRKWGAKTYGPCYLQWCHVMISLHMAWILLKNSLVVQYFLTVLLYYHSFGPGMMLNRSVIEIHFYCDAFLAHLNTGNFSLFWP